MARIEEFSLPDLGEGLAEGLILKWLVSVGDTVELNQPIVEVETAKATVEIPPKWAGTIHEIFHGEGTTVAVGSPIIAIDTGLPANSAIKSTAANNSAIMNTVDSTPKITERTSVLVGYGPRTGNTGRGATGRRAHPNGAPINAGSRPLAKPPVRKLAKDLGVDLALLTGSGPNGSITREDVNQARTTAATATAPATAREIRIPVTGVRKRVADNMVASAFTAPHATAYLTVDVTRGMRALDRLRAHPEWHDVRISPLLLVAKAVLLGITRHPMINSSWSAETDEIIVKKYVNLGIAAATERGLIVPNIPDAGRLTLRELAEALTGLVTAAKQGRTPPTNMTGGTFSITNVGVFGIDTGTPILPPGEATILAFGVIRDAPWVHKGRTKVRKVTTFGLSFDHRIVDGELGSRFLRDVGDFLNDPQTALLAWT